MAMMMEAPLAYPESPLEDDIAYPCKGCGKILEEGKAFELAGNRWHIDCFRCNTCSTLLDSDANLLLLGDGSLICNNCTYSCTACGNKIEDLAILTGDHAFCASCFRCRNCKKQIENLRYARTSQGIFCMECHEGLMARRRKKTKNSTSRHKQTSNNTMLLDKSLPSLPPSAVPQSAFMPDRETSPSDAYSDTPTELPAHVPASIKTSKAKSHAGARDQSPAQSEEGAKDNLTLPSTTYSTNRHSAASQQSNVSNGDDFYISMTLDPNPAPGPSPLIRHPKMEAQEEPPKQGSRDYFNAKVNPSRKPSHDQENTHPSSVAGSRGNSQPGSPQTPHIAYQEKGRDTTPEVLDVMRKRSVSGAATSHANGSAMNKGHDMPPRNGMKDTERFMLQEVPKRRKSGASARNSRSDINAPLIDTSMTSVVDPKSKSAPASASTNLKEQHVVLSASGSPKISQSESTLDSSPRASHDSKAATNGSVDSPKSHQSPKSTQLQHLPQRGDSLAPKSSGIARKEVGGGKWGSSPLSPDGTQIHHPLTPATSIGAQDSPMSSANLNGGRIISRPIESPISKSSTDFMQPPARAKDRPLLTGNSNGDSFVSPRAPPHPPPHPPMEIHHHKAKNESISTSQSEASRNDDHPASPALPRYSAGGDFSMAEDISRILGNDEPDQDQASFLRRVSNSVRHARSYSDRGTRLSREQKWPKSPPIATPGSKNSRDGTPTNMSPEGKDDMGNFVSELRRLRQQCNKKDQRIAELENALEGKANINWLDTELRKKRSTIVVLDTQKDMVIRELEIMTEKIGTAKKSDEPLNLGGLITLTLVEFADALQKLKDSFAPGIEDLTEKKLSLTEDVAILREERVRLINELDQTAARNAQLADLNNQLVQQVTGMQGIYQQATGHHMEVSRPHGLGIYTNQNKDKSNISLDSHDMQGSAMTGSSFNNEHDSEHATLLNPPQLVNIRKGQPKKFNWKKGGQNVAKGVSKGLKGAFTTNNSSDVTKYSREGSITEGMPYGSMPQSQDTPTTNPNGRNAINDPSRPGFGFFGNGKPKGVNSRANGNPPATVPEHASVLFGSELEERAEYERINIPGIITRCIQEVELRGMDAEGIYRKSGGNSQIIVVKEGFESSPDFDISDPDLDINAVTSTLKQYFRRLPTPLITYPVYDKLLDSTGAPDGETRIALMRSAINELPPHHRDCLEFLVFHLARVVERERENLMTSNNVAVVFAPTIMRPESIAREMSDTAAKNAAVQFLIENCQAVFLGDA